MVRLAVGTLALSLVGGIVMILMPAGGGGRTNAVAYFDNSNGIYPGDNVIILGVPVGKIDRIEPQRDRVKINFWYANKYKVPADAKAVILSPTLVTARSIQLTPAYSSGPVLANGATIPQNHTAVPVEYDDLRKELEKLAETLQPTKPGGVSTLGAFINTAADNLRGEGSDIRDTVIKLSQAVSALGDHSADLFSTFKNLSTLVSALHDSSGVLTQLNQNLAAVTKLVANDPDKVSRALQNLSDVADDVKSFVADNRETLGTTSDKLASVSQALADSREDLKQTLHVVAPAGMNFLNIYQPAQGALSGILAASNFANPIQFLCGAVQAASRLGGAESAKLCVQYLAPIIKNRQYPFLPLGINPFVGASARPNELTYSEDWLRPDYIPPAPPEPGQAPANQRAATNPDKGLQGMMVPAGGGQ
jgi:phospholipid/cholesterol/gamma-HCH transport system substrate-binding protein